MEYNYFVSFFFKNDTLSFGTGNAEVTRKNKITSFEDIREIVRQLEENEGVKNVTIISYTLLAESEEKQ